MCSLRALDGRAEEKPRAAPGGKPPKRQILVSAHTNVAVDRVLAGLVASGFTGAPAAARAPPLRR